MLYCNYGILRENNQFRCPVFGNHDNEITLGVSWQCKQLENAEHCLFKRGNVYGNGNYTVALSENGEIKRLFVMLDTHGCKTQMGLSEEQIEWYNSAVNRVKERFADVKISFVMHVQPFVFAKALDKYGFLGDNTINAPIDIDGKEITDAHIYYCEISREKLKDLRKGK